MKVLSNIKVFAQKVLRAQATKYTIVCLLGVLIVGFLDENSVWSHFKNKQRISDLEEEIAKYNADYERDQSQIRELNRNPKAMEKIARERYFMKVDDEDIFVMKEENQEPEQTVNDETAQ